MLSPGGRPPSLKKAHSTNSHASDSPRASMDAASTVSPVQFNPLTGSCSGGGAGMGHLSGSRSSCGVEPCRTTSIESIGSSADGGGSAGGGDGGGGGGGSLVPLSATATRARKPGKARKPTRHTSAIASSASNVSVLSDDDDDASHHPAAASSPSARREATATSPTRLSASVLPAAPLATAPLATAGLVGGPAGGNGAPTNMPTHLAAHGLPPPPCLASARSAPGVFSPAPAISSSLAGSIGQPGRTAPLAAGGGAFVERARAYSGLGGAAAGTLPPPPPPTLSGGGAAAALMAPPAARVASGSALIGGGLGGSARWALFQVSGSGVTGQASWANLHVRWPPRTPRTHTMQSPRLWSCGRALAVVLCTPLQLVWLT